MSKELSIFISAGDPSGDIAGFHLINQFINLNDNISFWGLGHQRMESAGQKQLVSGAELAVLGFWEVARKYLFFRRLMNQTVEAIKTRKPDVVILIDYPGFNLRLAEKIRDIGIPIIYYVSPQIWAWGGKRIHQIKRLVDLMLLILPFEKDIYEKAGIKNKFVGHYLFDDLKLEYIKAPYNHESNLIALLPGSRPQEVQRMLPTLISAAEILSGKGDFRFVIAGVESNIDYDKYIRKTDLPVEIIKGDTRELIRKSRLVLTSSGTATLETGIIGRPMVVIYKTGYLTYLIARRLVKLDKIALINIVAGERLVPELIQNSANPENIARQALNILNDNNMALEIVSKLQQATDSLGGPGSSGRAAKAIMELLNC